MIWLRMLALKSSNDTPCSLAAFSRSSIELQVVLLADLVQALHQFRFAGDIQFLALRQPQLLVDKVAQQFLPLRRHLLHRCAVLLSFLVQLGFRAVVVRLGDDFVVDAGDNVLDHGPAIGAFRFIDLAQRQGRPRRQQRSKCDHRNCSKNSQIHRVDVRPGGWRELSCCLMHRRHCKSRESKTESGGSDFACGERLKLRQSALAPR